MLNRFNAYKLGWLRDSLWLIMMVAVIFVLLRFIVGVSVVKGGSMEPTLKDGNIVVYLRLDRSYDTGDVVSVRIPSGQYYIKRIAAGGDETVEIYDGKLFIDNDLREDPYASGSTEREAGAVVYPYKVSAGNYFVLGDNREASVDSRYFGEVSRHQIRGRILFALTGSGIVRPDANGRS